MAARGESDRFELTAGSLSAIIVAVDPPLIIHYKLHLERTSRHFVIVDRADHRN